MTSSTSCEPGLPDDEEAEVDAEPESESDSALSAAIKFCMNVLNAAAISDPELEEAVVPEEAFVELELVEDAEFVVAPDPSAPTDASALNMAPMRPPPAGGCDALPNWDAPPTPEVLPLVWFCPANIADNADSGIESPELAIELTLMEDTPDFNNRFYRLVTLVDSHRADV